MRGNEIAALLQTTRENNPGVEKAWLIDAVYIMEKCRYAYADHQLEELREFVAELVHNSGNCK